MLQAQILDLTDDVKGKILLVDDQGEIYTKYLLIEQNLN